MNAKDFSSRLPVERSPLFTALRSLAGTPLREVAPLGQLQDWPRWDAATQRSANDRPAIG